MNIPPPNPAAHDDGRLMHDLTVVNGQISRYVFNFLDADAGRAAPISVAEERALAEDLSTLATRLKARADRRTALKSSPLCVEGTATPRQLTNGTQTEQR